MKIRIDRRRFKLINNNKLNYPGEFVINFNDYVAVYK